LNYNKLLDDTHSVNVIGGYSYQIDGYDGLAAQGENASSDYITSYNLGSLLQIENGSISSYKNESILISFFGRAVYDYKKKYFLTGSMRRDGSSKFGSGNEWGWFPSATFGWNLLEESFMEDVGFFDQLKLRVGYGITGNQDIPNNADKTLFTPSGTAINPETGEVVTSFQVAGGTNPNPNLKWEENAELNVGIDFGFLNGKISGSLELYNKSTYDLIYGFQVPVPPNKQRTTIANAGEISNKGIEATIQAYPYDGEKLDWKTILTFSANSQETKKLGNEEFELGEIPALFVSGRGLVGGINYAQVIREGLAIGTFVLPEYAGLSDDGKPLFYTAAGGVTRDVDKAERRVVGSAQPDFTLGWSNYFNLGKKIDFGFALRAVVGYDVLNVTRMVFSNPADLPTLNTLSEAIDEYETGLNSNPILSDYYLESGTFLRLDNVSVGYTFDINKNNNYLKGLRVSLTGTNVFMLTNYSGIDPELSYGGTEFGRDQYDVYPKTRTITLGLNAKF
jgi:iron complex outermembrane receptor protein